MKFAVPSTGSRTHRRPSLARSAAPLLLPHESDLRVLLPQIAANRPLDLHIDVRHHVAVAFGGDDCGHALADDRVGDVHRRGRGRHELRGVCHMVLARVHNADTMASNMG